MRIYKVLYFPKTGTNIFISYNKNNYSAWGFDKPHREGISIITELHLGKLHISKYTPLNSTENGNIKK